MVYINRRGYYFTTLKTESSKRYIITLPAPDAEKVLLLCTHNDGRLMMKEVLLRFLAAEGLNAHSFRHTHATQLIENGAAPKGVACRLGHANATITQNFYTHDTLNLQEENLSIFNKTLQTKFYLRSDFNGIGKDV